MKIKDVMTPNVTTVTPATTLEDAAKQMRDLNVGVLPVLEGHKLTGVITDRDITIRAGSQHWDFAKKTVADAMSKNPTCCKDTDELENAVHEMEARQIRRLPVQNAKGDLVGMVSLGDVALRASHELSGEALEAISRHGEMAMA
ncbi:MAG: CBS domain-containing protein [Maricaulaceae bacterium]|jgi:CBS domain-containing protein